MTDSIEWLGEFCFEEPTGGPGMRGGVSLTAVRGLAVEDLLRRLGAGDGQIGARAHYRDFDPLSVDAPWTPCMYGTSGEWSYVLEDSGVCAWYQHWADGNNSVMPRDGEEFVCLHANVAVQPSWLFYSPGDGGLLRAEFRHSLTGPAPRSESGRAHLLDSRMRSNGAVWPDPDGFSSPAEWRAFVEDRSAGLHAAVWRSVGEHTGLRIPRGAVESGDLPVALLVDPFM
ncbi:hypothetical protein ACH4E5_06665 [Streptomyces afghaniensis]|uniref:hypothetical protein n=1 Tax=Streptomyces afghaniensis TaxID=66865 RepID=UPI003788C7AA